MKKEKIAVALILVVVITGMVVGAIAQPSYRIEPAHVKAVNVWADESSLGEYYVQIVAGGPDYCWRPWKYVVLRLGNMIFVHVLRVYLRGAGCAAAEYYEEKVINLGRCFIPGMKYVVRVNDVKETFIGGQCDQIPP